MTKEGLPDPIKHYPHTHHRQVVWGDMDSLSHVNNTKYFYYCETARIEFLRGVGMELGADGPDQSSIGLALAETGCRFKVPVTYPDALIIATAISNIAETEFWVTHALYSNKLDSIAAEATARMVSFDFANGKRAPLSDPILKICQANRLG